MQIFNCCGTANCVIYAWGLLSLVGVFYAIFKMYQTGMFTSIKKNAGKKDAEKIILKKVK